MEQKVIVSVVITTYNDEKYIRQTLESILNQEVSFPYEIIIGDDCSTDCTVRMIELLQEEYPRGIIRLVKNKKKLGKQDFLNKLLKKCVGKYIAHCDGKDYWTERTKLEHQIDFLEKNEKYIGTAHNVCCVDRLGRKLSKEKSEYTFQAQHVYSYENALQYDKIGSMSSYVYRNIWLDMSPYDYKLFVNASINISDKLDITLGLTGDVYYFEEQWACNRCVKMGGGSKTNINKNNRDELYINCLYLNKYVKDRFHLEMQTDDLLFDLWYEAVITYLRDSSRKNLQVLQHIYRARKQGPIKRRTDVAKIWIMEKIFRNNARSYMWTSENVRIYGLYSPVHYWISDNGKCVYMGNAKVAGTSIKASMCHLPEMINDDKERHRFFSKKSYLLRRNQNLKEDFQDAFVFTFVRNPYERLVSCYMNKFIKDKKEGKVNCFSGYLFADFQRVKSFEEFCHKIFFIPDRYADAHFRSQHCVTHSFRKQKNVSFIGKYEQLYSDFEKIASEYDLPKLRHYNKSYEYDWRDYYTLKTAIIVYIRFYKDFKLYGYQKEFFEEIKYLLNHKKIVHK